MRDRPGPWALYLCGAARSGGRARTVYIPALAAEAVRRGAATSTQVRAALADISAINLELLARRQLD